MKQRINVKDVKRNMLLAEDLYSDRGSLLAASGSLLKDELINHLTRYGVYEVAIENDAEKVKAAIEKESHDEALVSRKEEKQREQIKKFTENESTVKKVLSGEKFKVFTKNYSTNVNALKNNLQAIAKDSSAVSSRNMINETKKLFDDAENTSDVVMMINNMKNADDATYMHSVNVSILCRLMGTWLNMTDGEIDRLTLCGVLHDIGKTEINSEVLKKPGALTDEEYNEIKKHTLLGYKILSNRMNDEHVMRAALEHHERFDGSGYPRALKGDDIDKYAQIVGITDVYDALTANRIYREGLCPFGVFEIMNKDRAGFQQRYLAMFLHNMAAAYIGSDVLLSDGRIGRVFRINVPEAWNPIVAFKDGSLLNLAKDDSVFIESMC